MSKEAVSNLQAAMAKAYKEGREQAGVSITHFAGRTLPLKYSNFQQIYKKLSQHYKKLNFDKISAKSRKTMLY